ncbi:MAG: ATP-binding protein [Candidatus Babeliales bacterium]
MKKNRIIKRTLEPYLKKASQSLPVVALVGPRQSGKTTLAKMSFPDYYYISLEDPDTRRRLESDPRTFLHETATKGGMIIDEIQRIPELLSYIQTIVDEKDTPGQFILTGSQNFLLNQAITQSLAGRVIFLTLLPLSIEELRNADMLPEKLESLIFKGGYPRIWSKDLTPEEIYPAYIHSYIERDVRQIQNVHDLKLFQNFLHLCAGRIGQVINFTSLGNDCGIDHKTVQAWLSILEESYIIFLFQPYYKNFGKRVIKAPKLYFYDTGIACSLLRIESANDVALHYARGALVESSIIADLYKQYYNIAREPGLYYWRDYKGTEIDCIVEQALALTPIEIKAGRTITPKFFKPLENWRKLTNSKNSNYIIYAGNEDQHWTQGTIVSWKSAGNLIETLKIK